MTNPLIDQGSLLNWPAIKTEHITPALDELLAKASEAVAKVTAPETPATWSDVVDPLEQALEMVPLVLPDEEAAGEIAQIREKMGEGVSFSDALTGSRLFDEIHRQMLRMGIAAGREDQVMAKIASTYEQQVEEGISDLVSIIEPTMVAALSIVIGAVLMSVMMPMAGIISSIL